MLTRIRVTIVAALLCVLVVPVLNAAIENPVVDFGLGYGKEGTRAAGDHTATSGDGLTIVGVVVDFNDPFADLNANGALNTPT
jgi:diacylglycerol kinase